SGSGSVAVTGLPASWTPGQTYLLTVTARRPGAVVYGFQLSTVRNANNAQAGTLALTSPTTTKIVPGSGIQFAEHSTPSSTGIFTVNWTAPSDTAVGTVRINVAGNTKNGDGTNLGDFIYTQVYAVDPLPTPPTRPPPPQSGET